MSNSTYSHIDSIVPAEIINSGDYKNAENLIKKKEGSQEILVDLFYLLGNKFFSAKKNYAAELSWKESRKIFFQNSQDSKLQKFVKVINKKFFSKLKIIFFGIFIIFYLFLLLFFKRESLNSQIELENFSSNEISIWDEWWDTGRPSQDQIIRRYGIGELWPLINQTLEKLLGSNKIHNGDVIEKLKRWLEFAKRPNFKQGATDYYSLTARGLFEAREFDEAVSTLNDSIHFAEKPQEFEQIYQDLGTVFYYRGYKLNPNGLANYEISDVKKSVESYEIALRYGDDPYLYGNLGWGYYLLGDFDSSIKNSIEALEFKPELNYVRMNLGIAYLKKGNFEMSFNAYATLPKYNAVRDEYEGGIRDLMELQMEYPSLYPFTNFVIGLLYWQQGHFKKSESYLKKFIYLNFSHEIWKNRAKLILQKMRDEKLF